MIRASRIPSRSSSGSGAVISALVAVAALAASTWMPGSALGQGPARPVQHLIEVAQDLFPEVETQRVLPSPKPGEPSAILTARLRLDVAVRRVRQASERARTFPGGAVAGEATEVGEGVRLAVHGGSGREIGAIVVIGAGREVRIEVRVADAGTPPAESLPQVPVSPGPVMRMFPLGE